MTLLRDYLASLWHHWRAAITGGSVTAVLTAWLITGHVVAPEVGVAFVVGMVVVASFGAWKDEHLRVIAATGTPSRDRAIRDARVASALRAEVARLEKEIVASTESVGRATDVAPHVLVADLRKEMVEIDPESLQHFVQLETDVNEWRTVLLERNAQASELQTHREYVRRAAELRPGSNSLAKDLVLSQAETSRDYIPELERELVLAQNRLNESEKRVRATIRALDACLQRTTNARG